VLMIQNHRFPNGAGWIARHDRAGGHVTGYDASRSDDRVFADGNATEYDRAGPDRGAAPDSRHHDLPIVLGLQSPVPRGAWIPIVGEDHMMPDKDIILDGNPLANE